MKGIRIGNVEAQDEHVRIRIGQGSDGVIVNLARCVPDRVLDRDVVDEALCRVLFEIRRNVIL